MNIFKNILIIIISFVVCLFFFKRKSNINCKKIINPKDCYTQPKILFHASNKKNIKILEPNKLKYSDKKEGPVIFSTLI